MQAFTGKFHCDSLHTIVWKVFNHILTKYMYMCLCRSCIVADDKNVSLWKSVIKRVFQTQALKTKSLILHLIKFFFKIHKLFFIFTFKAFYSVFTLKYIFTITCGVQHLWCNNSCIHQNSLHTLAISGQESTCSVSICIGLLWGQWRISGWGNTAKTPTWMTFKLRIFVLFFLCKCLQFLKSRCTFSKSKRI